MLNGFHGSIVSNTNGEGKKVDFMDAGNDTLILRDRDAESSSHVTDDTHHNVNDQDVRVPGPSYNTNIHNNELSAQSTFFNLNTSPHNHNEEIVDYLYNVGFQLGEYADTILHAHQNIYRLHAIILSRSPYIAHLISMSHKVNGMHNIYVPLENIPQITDQGFAVALGYLYSSHSLSSLSLHNARAVLAAANLLGGMDELSHYAYHSCKNSININSIIDWVHFIDALMMPEHTSSGSSDSNSNSRSATPSSSDRLQYSLHASTSLTQQVQQQQQQHSVGTTTIFGLYASRLRSDVIDFLISLPDALDINPNSPSNSIQATQSHTQGPGHTNPESGREALLNIFSYLSFDMFKIAIESINFQIGSDQERFKFAKAAIELRKQRTRGNGVEETVVLAFGGESGRSAVHVTRKIRKRKLFKVG